MPASIGLRTRPGFGSLRGGTQRSLASRRMHIGQFLRSVPLEVLGPLVVIAGLTAGFALNSIHTIHTEEVAAMDSLPMTTGTVTPRN
jgi:hypothetical protein